MNERQYVESLVVSFRFNVAERLITVCSSTSVLCAFLFQLFPYKSKRFFFCFVVKNVLHFSLYFLVKNTQCLPPFKQNALLSTGHVTPG